MQRIDTMEQFLAARAASQPVYVESKTHGRVLVPCVNTLLVRTTMVVANAYNPNHVSNDKMSLLQQSIIDNGFCFPVVVIWDDADCKFVIIDGFHRSVIAGGDWLDLDYLPVVVLAHGIEQRMVATVQFNKARGVHQVDLDADLIRALVDQGMPNEEIAAKLGIETEAVHRYKQIAGVASLFANSEYSRAWDMQEEP